MNKCMHLLKEEDSRKFIVKELVGVVFTLIYLCS